MLVPLNDHVGRALYFFGDLDPKVTWVIKRLLKPGDVALDVGANLGFLSIFMSKLIGPQGVVHAFEPNPDLCRILKRSFDHNHVTNVKLHPVALGATNQDMELRVPNHNLGAGSLLRETSKSAQTIKCVSYDSMMLSFRRASRSSLWSSLMLKDFELEVLKGARRVFHEIRPALLFESNEKTSPTEVTPVMKCLHGYGYQFILIPRRLMRMRTKLVNFDRPGDVEGHDVIAAPNGALFSAMRHLLRAE